MGRYKTEKKLITKRNKEIMGFVARLSARYDVTCIECTECHCCKANEGVPITGYEYNVLKTLVTEEQKIRAVASDTQMLITGNYDCPFLSSEGICEVYNFRPLACSSYTVIGHAADDCKDSYSDVHFIDQKDILKHIPHLLPNDDLKVSKDILDVFKQ